MAENSRLKYFTDVKEYFFYIKSSEIEKDIEYIKKNKINNIAINKYKGFLSNDISQLRELTHVKKISLEPSDIVDVGDTLAKLKKLEYLHLGVEKVAFDFSNLPNLKRLYFDYHKNTKGIEHLINLEVLHIYYANKFFFKEDQIGSLKNLKRLEIVKSDDLDNLNCLSKLINLKELEFHYCRSLIDFNFLTYLKYKLEILKIGNCKNVKNVEYIDSLEKLKWLAIVDSFKIKNVNFIKNLRNLEVLIVLGKSYFEDGDLSILRERKLRHVGIDNKRHYNVKYEEFKKPN